MSELSRAPKPHPRSPIRRARPTKRSASGPRDRVASTRDVAIYFREDCRTLRDSLQLEMVVAQYCLRIAEVRTTAGLPVGDATGAGVVAELEGCGDPLSHAILLGIGHLGSGETAVLAAEAVARLEERSIGLPEQFVDVGRATAVGAWRAVGEGGELALFAEFEHPRGRRHTIALFIEPRDGGTVKHIGLLGGMHELDPDEPLHPNALETLETASAAALMREVLGRSYGPRAAVSDDYRVVIALARARSMTLPPGDAADANDP